MAARSVGVPNRAPRVRCRPARPVRGGGSSCSAEVSFKPTGPADPVVEIARRSSRGRRRRRSTRAWRRRLAQCFVPRWRARYHLAGGDLRPRRLAARPPIGHHCPAHGPGRARTCAVSTVGSGGSMTIPHDPDYRFTLANERTFLAWLRTSLALIAAGVAVVQLVPEFGIDGARRAVGMVLVGLGILVSLAGTTDGGRSNKRWPTVTICPRPECRCCSAPPSPSSRPSSLCWFWLHRDTPTRLLGRTRRSTGAADRTNPPVLGARCTGRRRKRRTAAATAQPRLGGSRAGAVRPGPRAGAGPYWYPPGQPHRGRQPPRTGSTRASSDQRRRRHLVRNGGTRPAQLHHVLTKCDPESGSTVVRLLAPRHRLRLGPTGAPRAVPRVPAG